LKGNEHGLYDLLQSLWIQSTPSSTRSASVTATTRSAHRGHQTLGSAAAVISVAITVTAADSFRTVCLGIASTRSRIVGIACLLRQGA
jgi:hypothetical protein